MLLILIASTLVCSTAASEFSLSVPNGSVSEPLGSSAVLPCGLSPSLNAETFEIRWHRNDHKNPVLLYKDLQIQENTGGPQYRRVSLTGELEKGNVSLKLENLTLADAGKYVCYVKSPIWYESATVNLIVKALGSPPLFSLAKAGDQVNVTCASDGWSPKPTLTWRDRGGRELGKSHIHYETDSEGLVSVSSWLLFPSSESEWISCSVGISDQEMVESRVHPVIRLQAWREALISTLVLSLIIIIILAALLLKTLKHRKGASSQQSGSQGSKKERLKCWPKMKKQKEKPTSDTHSGSRITTQDEKEETQPLTGTGSPVPPISAEERMKIWNKHKERKEKLTLDPETRHTSLTIKQGGTGVYNKQLDLQRQLQSDPLPHILSKEEFSSGLNYWEVKVKQKLSWCVGVTQKPPTKETLTALCYEEGRGIYTSTDPRTEVPAEGPVTTLGLLLDFKHSLLSFYNVDPPSHIHTFTMENMKNRTYCALISPGCKDTELVSFQS